MGLGQTCIDISITLHGARSNVRILITKDYLAWGSVKHALSLTITITLHGARSNVHSLITITVTLHGARLNMHIWRLSLPPSVVVMKLISSRSSCCSSCSYLYV